MKTIRVLLAVFLLMATIVPARADFKYTETSQITGGALVGAMKVASVFARGDAKKALQPITTTHYLKGNRLRTDRPDGTAEIIDLDGQRVIAIDFNKKTYAVATFEQIKAEMEQAQKRMQEELAKNPKQKQQAQDTQVKITPTIHVTPGTGSRVILDQPTKETKVQMDLAVQATDTSAGAPPPGQPNAANMTMDMDTFVAPGVAEYQEFAQFYRRMAQDVNWMKLPAMNVQIDPRMAQGMSELQKNSDALKGFPLLSYTSMSVTTVGADGKPITQDNAKQQPSNPPPSKSSASDDSSLDSPSAAVMKGLGGLFGKKKQQDNSAQSGQTGAPPPNPNANPNALMEMTTQVTSFSASSLDGGLFDIPSGFMLVQEDAMQVFGGGSPSQPGKK